MNLGQMDELLPVALEDAISLFLRALGVMIINSVANWFRCVHKIGNTK